MSLGIIFALGALICWTFGDFFIQRSARLVGIWNALFYITGLGAVVLLPFVYKEIVPTWSSASVLLLTMSVVMLIVALFDFEALKLGKIAVIEPVYGLELPVTVGLAVIFAGDRLSWSDIALIAAIFLGIVLAAATRIEHLHVHKRLLEKGVILAATGAVGMALANFLTGLSSRATSPLLAIWFMHTFLALVCLIYLGARGRLKTLWTGFRRYPLPVIAESVFDNLSWIFYASAMTYIPISIATAISESYIAFAALLGILINREKIRRHQYFGIALTVIGVIALSLTTNY